MSILVKPYTISVWDDVLEGGRFVEKRLGVIGSDKMVAQCRAIEPNLVRNVNGTKKFSFKMYSQYIDNITGEKVHNPFVDWLISERKVKLQYDNQWFDFIIKDISENSSTHLNTYQLEDALVQELSKNGFGVTLDAELMNNMNTAGELGTNVLEETDWTVSSEVFVEKVEETLVYVQFPNNIGDLDVYQLKDQVAPYTAGVVPQQLTDEQIDNLKGKTMLAFYSSCTNRPHRFQFIYLSDGYSKDKPGEPGKYLPRKITDENSVINEKDCQYYIDIAKPEDETAGYQKIAETGLPIFYLPEGWSIIETSNTGIGNNGDTTVSNWYRGARYGFAQQAEYIPLLERYCQKFKKGDEEYYGYVDTKYESPVFLQNIVTNTEFKGTSGWIGTYTSKDTGSNPTASVKSLVGAKVESVYGLFDSDSGNSKEFISVVDELANGTYNTDKPYTSYLKVEFPQTTDTDRPILINTGFYDNRTLIESIGENEQWYLNPTILDEEGNNVSSHFTFALWEYDYHTDSGGYKLVQNWTADLAIGDQDYCKFGFNQYAKIQKTDFVKKKVGLVFKCDSNESKTYYIKDIQLYKYIESKDESGNTIHLEPGKANINGVTTTTYKLFPATYLDDESTSIDDIKYDIFDKKDIDFSVYAPMYNEGAQKVRAVNAKESNYFNILQSIAETFECWVDLVVERNDPNEPGKITGKTVKFKNYSGSDNYAAFRYGVNLKDIQRTYASKNIVTKLMVKANSNELAKNGFCTIQRAGANPTGESHIYDFRYFHDTGLLDAEQYVAEMYYVTNPKNEIKAANGNIQNYFNRVKALNDQIVSLNDAIIPLQQDLTKLNADLIVEEGLRDAASEGLEEVREDFYNLTGVQIENITSATTEIDTEASNIVNLLTQYATYQAQYNSSSTKVGNDGSDEATPSGLKEDIKLKEEEIADKKDLLKTAKDDKKALNKEFFKKYSRFIQEGTWISEEYVDDDKYYTDALSVMYNSCYPQVAYTINVLSLGALPGYELFNFEVGDKTYAEDPDFFGIDLREEVIIAEMSNMLDDPSKDTIRVQNFKNQFQDLFQKITATVQQTQYSTGSYEKAVALAEADAAVKGEFLSEALGQAHSKLTAAGQTTVVQDASGITLTDSNTQDQMRLIGGAILMSVQDEETKERKWKTGLTPKGISASLVTAGTINTGNISIMNGKDITFMMNEYGITAFDADWGDGGVASVNKAQFVRFDKHGLYGIGDTNGVVYDGITWKPDNLEAVTNNATFALTWKGLKVTGEGKSVVNIGKQGDYIMLINDADNNAIFSVQPNGHAYLAGWDVTSSKLTTGEIGAAGSFGIYPQGITSGLNSDFKGTIEKDDAWVLTAGDSFGITKQGSMFASAGKVGGWQISGDGIKSGTVGLISTNGDLAANSLVDETDTSPIRFHSGKSNAGRSGVVGTVFTWGEAYGTDTQSTINYCLKIANNTYLVFDELPARETDVITYTYNRSTNELTYVGNGAAGYITESCNAILVYDEQRQEFDGEAVCLDVPTTMILDDGSLYTSAANIKGHIEADSGNIGELLIKDGSIQFSTGQSIIESFTSLASEDYYIFEGLNPDFQFTYVAKSKLNTVEKLSTPLMISKTTTQPLRKIDFDKTRSLILTVPNNGYCALGSFTSNEFTRGGFNKFVYGNGQVFFDASSLSGEQYICIFCEDDLKNGFTSNVRLESYGIKAELSKNGYCGCVLPYTTTSAEGLRQLYIDQEGQLVVLG